MHDGRQKVTSGWFVSFSFYSPPLLHVHFPDIISEISQKVGGQGWCKSLKCHSHFKSSHRSSIILSPRGVPQVVYSCAYWTGFSVSLQNWLSPAGTSVTPNKASSARRRNTSSSFQWKRTRNIFITQGAVTWRGDVRPRLSSMCGWTWLPRQVVVSSSSSWFVLSKTLRCLPSFVTP